MFSFPFLLPALFLDCVWHEKHFENLQGKFLSLSPDRENKKMRFVNKKKKKKKKSQLETTRKRGGSIVWLYSRWEMELRRRRRRAFEWIVTKTATYGETTHRCLRNSFFPFGKVKVCYYTEESWSPPLLLLSRKGMIINRPLEPTGREELWSSWV